MSGRVLWRRTQDSPLIWRLPLLVVGVGVGDDAVGARIGLREW